MPVRLWYGGACALSSSGTLAFFAELLKCHHSCLMRPFAFAPDKYYQGSENIGNCQPPPPQPAKKKRNCSRLLPSSKKLVEVDKGLNNLSASFEGIPASAISWVINSMKSSEGTFSGNRMTDSAMAEARGAHSPRRRVSQTFNGSDEHVGSPHQQLPLTTAVGGFACMLVPALNRTGVAQSLSWID